jgi:hypothetical protein
MEMEKLKEILSIGNQILENSKQKFHKNNNDTIKSYIKYIEYIQKEFNKITVAIQVQNMPDFQKGCIYFGTGTLYYSSEFLKYDNEKMANIIFNHIIHFTGCLYIINAKQVRLSYIMQAMSILYGKPFDYTEGKNIYQNHNIEFDHIILDIKNSYQSFIINNRNIMPFITAVKNDDTKYIIYRIILGKDVILKNMELNITNDKIVQVSEYVNEKDQCYSLIS